MSKNKAAMALGKLGGLARAKTMSKTARRAQARKAALAMHAKKKLAL